MPVRCHRPRPHPGDTTWILIKTLVASAAALAALTVASPALADITVDIMLPLTGPAAGLGIPVQSYFKHWPTSIAG